MDTTGTLTPERWRRVQEILDAFDDLPPAERPGFVEIACRDDSALRRNVEAFLKNEDRIGSFLERPLFPICSENLDDAVLVPRIGPYKLRRELGEGGMGTVYLATQEEPFRRSVALKLIRPEILSRDTVRRFEAERQILAGIRHPNVAQIYDGGTTPDGRPYFVMEYVEGEPIQEYCDAHRLPTRERLELFGQVCSAVHLAHQKLRVVHRDLKPGNILVTSDGVPKLLDFGIAKPIDAELPSPGSAVEQPASAWTPHYSSPEQLGGMPLTTASDIYSLGVLLYRLLTGRLPYRLESAEPEVVRRAIGEQEPERPSVVVQRDESRLEDGTAVRLTPRSVSRARDGTPGKLRRRLAGDLDAIVLKALAKDPESRYDSVERLTADLRRYLKGLPVLAREPTLIYRTGKFVRRYRLRLAAAAVLVVLGCGLIVAQAREIAQVRRVSASLVDLLTALQPATPDQRVEIEAALEKAARIIDDPMFANHPLDQAMLMDALGRGYTSLGRYDRAEALLENALKLRRRALGEDHVLVAESLNDLAFLYQHMGDAEQSEAHLRRSLEIRYQSSDPDVAELSHSINNLAIALYDRGYYAEAEPLFRRVITMRRSLYDDDHPAVVRARSNLAAVLVQQGAYDVAEALYRRNLEVRLQLHGPEHRDVAAGRSQLATVLYAQGELDAAEAEAREALRIRREVFGLEHRDVALVLNNLGMILQAGDAHEEAEDAYRRALAIFRQQLGDDHVHVAVTKKNLAEVLTAKDDPEAAGRLAVQALETLRAAMAPGSWRIADAESVYGGCLAAQGRFTEAEELLVRSFEIIREARGEWAPYTRNAARRLVGLYEAWEKPEQAEAYRRIAA
ncbi:MAG: serine/threonine protein kinase [bacterium]|nr:serine/threonine protein kinase [bacterium]